MSIRATDKRGYYGVSNKTIVVDFGPPESPIVTFPADKMVISESEDEDADRAGVQLSVKGNAEPESLVKIAVTGGLTYEGVTAVSGKFVVDGVTIREHGVNTITITATDVADNQSAPTTLTIIKNDSPTIRFRSPRLGGGLNHVAIIRWDIADSDGDTTTAPTLSYRDGTNGPFVIIKKSIQGNTYDWDVSKLREGSGYQLKLETTDGVSPGVKIIGTTIDNTPPSVAPIKLPNTAFRESFTLNFVSEVSDTLSGIEYVEYAIQKERGAFSSALDDAKGVDGSWYTALITRGYLTKKAQATIKHPLQLTDGTYIVSVRSVDAAGNVSPVVTTKITIDTTPPHIGSFALSRGELVFYPRPSLSEPTGTSRFFIAEGDKLHIKLSLENDTQSATLYRSFSSATETPTSVSSNDDETMALVRETRSGLWEADGILSGIGLSELSVVAVDRLGNSSEKTPLGLLDIIESGRVTDEENHALSGARILVQAFNPDSGVFVDWDAAQFGLRATEETDANGHFSLLLPQGTYRLNVQKSGYGQLQSPVFEVVNPEYITPVFQMKTRVGLIGEIENILERISFF